MKTIIMPIDNGPYHITGDVEMVDGEGKPLGNAESIPVDLCRCGRSGHKPFCDGSHAREGFNSEIRAPKK